MLLLWSGGVESTSLLKYLLTETTEPVTAVHIYCPNRLERVEQEWAAVEALLPLLQQLRSFVFHRVDLSFPFLVRDSELQTACLPSLLVGTGEKQFVRGLCLEDWQNLPGFTPQVMHPDVARAVFGRRIAQHIIDYFRDDSSTAFTLDSGDWREVSPFYPHMLWPKKQHMRYLGDLLPLTWSCLSPIGTAMKRVPCRRCKTCVMRNQALVELKQEKEVHEQAS